MPPCSVGVALVGRESGGYVDVTSVLTVDFLHDGTEYLAMSRCVGISVGVDIEVYHLVDDCVFPDMLLAVKYVADTEFEVAVGRFAYNLAGNAESQLPQP